MILVQRIIKLICTILLCVMTWATFAHAESLSEASPQIAEPCPYLGDDASPIFRRLQAIDLFIEPPSLYVHAIKCHGREEQCANGPENNGTLANDKYIRQLKDLYNAYPSPLLPDALQVLFTKEVQRGWSRYLRPDAACNYPAPVLRNASPVPKGRNIEDVLQVTVQVSIEEDTQPRVAVVTLSHFRPRKEIFSHQPLIELYSMCTERQRPWVKAFPVDMPVDQMVKALEDFAYRSIGGPPIPYDLGIPQKESRKEGLSIP